MEITVLYTVSLEKVGIVGHLKFVSLHGQISW